MFTALFLALTIADPNDFVVPRGQITFDVEGNEGGRWHSRTPHVPSDSSGLTIGRGYDMRYRSAEKISKQMADAGIPADAVKKYAGAAKLFGDKAREYMKTADLPEITPVQQKALFLITYAEIEEYAQKLCTGPEVVKQYGPVDWDKLNPTIRDLVIDLRYRGDYTAKTREYVQPVVVKNDLKGLADVLSDRSKWSNVPEDRFKRRAAYAKKALDVGK
ncbi:MAG TPA: hypothetical protein VHR66_19660 [Gemmataceae bacterium]|jgi:hypothetical protein|nr:hypothetical protein [Gemmataceae bacterium]